MDKFLSVKEAIMEKFRFSMEYQCRRQKFCDKSARDRALHYGRQNETDHIKLVINPKIQITVNDLTVTFPAVINADSRIFANGYQSWTDCREYFTNESQSAIVHKYNVLAHKTRIGASGDYGIHKIFIGREGVFPGLFIRLHRETARSMTSSVN